MAIELTKAQQESVAYDAGDLLVKGVAGSGKSIVLLYRALQFNRKAIERNEKKRIVILTYAKSLVKYTSELVDLQQLSDPMIEIMTIDKCCYDVYRAITNNKNIKILDESKDRKEHVETAIKNHLSKNPKHRFHDLDASFWSDEFKWIKEKNIVTKNQYVETERTGRGGKVRMTKEDKAIAYDIFKEYCSVLQKHKVQEWEDLYAYIIYNYQKIPEDFKYDYVLVDEAQDLSFIKLKVAKLLTKKTITIAADKAQKIYNTSFSWKELGIDIRGKASKSLETSFRSTKQIVQLAESLLEVNRAMQEDKSEFTEAIIPSRNGSIPKIIKCDNDLSERQFVLNLVRKHSENNDVIGILYRSNKEASAIKKWLASENIPYQKIKRSSEWSLNTPGVKLTTIHSSKGLEFDVVIIPMFKSNVFPLKNLLDGADKEQISEIKAQERSLLYVGMTRSKYDLYLTFTGEPSEFILDFQPEYYDYINDKNISLSKPAHIITTISSDKNIKSSKKVYPLKGPSVLYKTDKSKIGQVKEGNKVTAHIIGSDKSSVFIIDTRKYRMQKTILGKNIGDQFVLQKQIYQIDNIE